MLAPGTFNNDDIALVPPPLENGGGGFPNQNKNSTIQDWKNLSKDYYDVSTEVAGIKVPILWGTDAVHGHNNVIV